MLARMTTVAGAACLLIGCAASQKQIAAFGAGAAATDQKARAAMISGDRATAVALYEQADATLDRQDSTYLDGYFYAHRARRIGNGAMMALVAGDGAQARSLFTQSSQVFDDGVARHRALLEERRNARIAATVILTVAAGAAAVGATANTGVDSSEFISDLGELSAETISQISETMKLDVVDDAQNVQSDQWRAAVLSDHPMVSATVQVQTGKSACTGAYIAPRLIATAAHCIRVEGGGETKVYRYAVEQPATFLAGQPPEVPVEAVYVHPGYGPEYSADYDVALIVVSQAHPHPLKVRKRPIETVHDASVMGFSGDLNRGFFLRLDHGCAARVESELVLRMDCAVYPGASGGPIFVRDAAGRPFELVAVVSGGPEGTAGRRISLGRGNTGARIELLNDMYSAVLREHPGAGPSNLFAR